MTPSLEDDLQAAGGPVEYIRTVGRNASSDHLRLFADLPPEITNWREEQLAWKETCGMSDLSHHMTDLTVEGPDALDVFADLGINDFSNFGVGKAKQFVACSPDGYIIGDGILFHLDENTYTLVGYAPINWVAYHLDTGDYDVTASRDEHGGVRDGPPETFRYQVQGPEALKIITEALDGDLPEVPFFNFRPVTVAGHEINALRHGMMDEPGFELFGPYEHADDVRNALREAGREYGLREIGGKAYPTNVIPTAWMSVPVPAIYHDGMAEYREWLDADCFEGALAVGGSFHSEDITDYYLTPVEAGFGRFVDLDREFVGRDAVADQLDAQERTKVTLIWDEDDVKELTGAMFDADHTYRYTELPIPEWSLAQTDEVRADGETVGTANNTRYLYWEKEMFSLAAIDAEYAEPGTEVTLVWGEPDSPNPRVEDHEVMEVSATVYAAPYTEDKRKTADYSAV